MRASEFEPDDDTDAWLVLLRAPGLGGTALRRLIERAGSARGAYANVLTRPGEQQIAQSALDYLRSPDRQRLFQDREWLQQPLHHLLTWEHVDYPALLRPIGSPPPALFVVGEPAWLWSAQIAIVGSRSASAGGLVNARSFAKSLAGCGFVVTSGLADGVDGAAHCAALDAGAATIAVVGTGPDLVYPRKHRQLAERIREHGALVSEFPPGTPGKPENFPRRNRIIAGLSLGSLIVEASLKSGSLITARLAAEQGREVFAIPGSIHNPLARGCHQLIREGARLVETAEEVIAELGALAQSLSESLRQRIALGGDAQTAQVDPTRDPSSRSGDPDYVKLLGALGHDAVGMDTLAGRTGLTVAALSSMLLVLELDGLVVAARGGLYARAYPPELAHRAGA